MDKPFGAARRIHRTPERTAVGPSPPSLAWRHLSEPTFLFRSLRGSRDDRLSRNIPVLREELLDPGERLRRARAALAKAGRSLARLGECTGPVAVAADQDLSQEETVLGLACMHNLVRIVDGDCPPQQRQRLGPPCPSASSPRFPRDWATSTCPEGSSLAATA